MKTIAVLFLTLLLLTGCAHQAQAPSAPTTVPAPQETALPPEPETTVPETEPYDPIAEILGDMTLEQRVGQLFLARCDEASAVEHARQYHLGGYVLFGADFQEETPDTLREKLNTYQANAELPLLIAVDEEGGTVTRVSSNRAFRDSSFASIRTLYGQGGIDGVLQTEEEKCALLQSLGINVNLGPVCDITTDPAAFMYKRSLGQDARTTAGCIAQMVSVMNRYRIGSALKHFPGYGNNTDTHTGIAYDSRSLTELEETDLIPFSGGIAAGCGAIMVSHTMVEALDSGLPASLSPAVHRYIRDEMGFGGVIITDDLVMQAITDLYGAGEAAVMAVLAGNDLLCSTEYILQYEAVLAAVLDGRIPFDTLTAAVRNVLEWKMDLGLI